MSAIPAGGPVSAGAVEDLGLRAGAADPEVAVVPAHDVQQHLTAPAHLGHLALADRVPDVAAGNGEPIAYGCPPLK